MAEEESAEGGGGKLDGLKQNKMLLFIIIGVVALLLIIVIVVALLAFSGGGEEEQAAAPQMSAAAAAPGAAAGAGAGGNTRASKLKIGPIYPLDQFIVNLMTSGGGKRYLKTSIGMEISIAEMTPELDMKRDVIRDTIIGVMSAKTFEEIQTEKGKRRLKDELIERINEFLVDGRVVDLYFNEFVIQ